MTLVQETAEIMNKMPRHSQALVLDLLRVMNYSAMPFKRTGKSKFNLPPDFDEHFDDSNEEIASMFCGEFF